MDEKIKVPIKCDVKLIVLDKNGNVIKEICKEDDLLVRNAVRYLFGELTDRAQQLKAETGATINATFGADASNNFNWISKIAVGTNNTAPTFDDYNLLNKVAETSSLFVENVSETGQTLTFDIRATFYFASAIDIGEVGLFGKAWSNSPAGSFNILIARDTLTPKLSVPADAYLVVRYRFILGIT